MPPADHDRTRPVHVARHDEGSVAPFDDTVATEDPLEIRLGDTPLAVVMRTPGDDEDLLTGFLITEGILLDPAEIDDIESIDESRVAVHLREGIDVDAARFQRNMFMSSSCGVCGKASIDQVRLFARPAPAFTVAPDVLVTLTDRLRAHQPTFDATGGLHAAGLFDPAGRLVEAREDVGRHNAVDKVIGSVARRAWPLPESILVVSGRQSFEIVQKAAVAGVGGIVGVSAPSSLAVELASEIGMLLVGFARGSRFNVYSGEDRVKREKGEGRRKE